MEALIHRVEVLLVRKGHAASAWLSWTEARCLVKSVTTRDYSAKEAVCSRWRPMSTANQVNDSSWTSSPDEMNKAPSNIWLQQHGTSQAWTVQWSPSQILDPRLFLAAKWSESHSGMSDTLQPHGLYSPWNSPGQNTGVGRAVPFSRGSSQPRDQTQVSWIAGGFITS